MRKMFGLRKKKTHLDELICEASLEETLAAAKDERLWKTSVSLTNEGKRSLESTNINNGASGLLHSLVSEVECLRVIISFLYFSRPDSKSKQTHPRLPTHSMSCTGEALVTRVLQNHCNANVNIMQSLCCSIHRTWEDRTNTVWYKRDRWKIYNTTKISS